MEVIRPGPGILAWPSRNRMNMPARGNKSRPEKKAHRGKQQPSRRASYPAQPERASTGLAGGPGGPAGMKSQRPSRRGLAPAWLEDPAGWRREGPTGAGSLGPAGRTPAGPAGQGRSGPGGPYAGQAGEGGRPSRGRSRSACPG
jgi:hypothetical protein